MPRYLRLFKKRHDVGDGTLSPDAFVCVGEETGLSFHLQDPPLDTEAGVSEYQSAFAYPNGDLRGVCQCAPVCFGAERLPAPKRAPDSEPYFMHHCELSPCPEREESVRCAFHAAILRPFVKAR